jgi:hypothetical protein
VLDTNVPTQARVVGVGDVTCGEDVHIGGAEMLIDEDPIVDLEAGLCGELGVGSDSDSDEDHVGVDPAPVAQNDSGHRTVSAAEFGNRDLAAQVHAVVTMQVGKDRCGLWTEHVQQRQFAALEKSHVNPCIACSGGSLQPDPAGADDGNPMRLGEPSQGSGWAKMVSRSALPWR